MRLKEELKMECHKKRNLCFTCIHFCPLMPPLSTYGYKWQEMCVITGRTFLFMIFFDCHNSVHPFWGGAKESLLPKRLFLTRDGLSRPITHSAVLRLLAFNSILIKTPANPYLARFLPAPAPSSFTNPLPPFGKPQRLRFQCSKIYGFLINVYIIDWMYNKLFDQNENNLFIFIII